MKIANVSKLERFSDLIQRDDDQINSSDVKQIINEIHHRRIFNFQRLPFIQRGLDNTFEADLLDMVKLKSSNYGYRYILMVLDTYSKFLWTRGLKMKTGAATAAAFEDILMMNKRIPRKIHCDKGKIVYFSSLSMFFFNYFIFQAKNFITAVS